MKKVTRPDTPVVQPTARVALSTRIIIGVAMGALSAVMLILAFPPYNVWPLIFLAFVPILLADYRVLPLRWAGLANAIGVGVWLAVYLAMIFGLSTSTWFMQAIALLVAVMLFATGRGLRVFNEHTRYRWFVLSGVEMIRSFIPIIATHAFVGHAVHTQPWLIQPVSIFSIYGLDVLIVLLNYVLAQAALGLFDRKWRWDAVPDVDRRLKTRWLAGAASLLVAWVGLSLVLLAGAPKDAPIVRVAAIQHGYVKPGHLDPDTQEAKLCRSCPRARVRRRCRVRSSWCGPSLDWDLTRK